MTTNTHVMAPYTEAITNLPEDAFLGSLLFFSINQADVHLINAKRDLTNAGLSIDSLRKNLRPVDAFRKATKEFEKKFGTHNGQRSELMVRSVGEDGQQAHRHLIMERATMQAGKKRQIRFEKVGEVVFERGRKEYGDYVGDGVSAKRTTDNLIEPLTQAEDQWLTERLVTFEDRYDHLLNFMDSHAVRTFVREYIYNLSGTCVKSSGGLYFIKQEHDAKVKALASWVKSVGSEFHFLPLLNLSDQREMILEAFEEETLQEVNRLMGEVNAILADPSRTIEEKTFDAYGMKAAMLNKKVGEYNSMLDTRAENAATELGIFTQQVLALAPRIRESKTTRAKVIPSA